MKYKIILKVEILILIILFAMFILSVFYAYMALRKSENIISSSAPIEENSSQKYELTCSQIDKAVFDKISKKYSVTLGSNSSNTAWSIQNNLNCSPTGGSGSVFTTKCEDIGQSKATVSYGEIQNTCQFSTIL